MCGLKNKTIFIDVSTSGWKMAATKASKEQKYDRQLR